VVAKTSSEARSRIDAFLPSHDFRASYHIRINAPRSVVYECLLHSDFNELWLTRLLMTLRTGKRMRRHRTPGDLRQRLPGTGFFVLEEVPEDELVIGVAGRFWRPDGERCMDLTVARFVEFSRPGYAKAVWNFKLRAELPEILSETLSEIESTTLSTETRIQCFGRAALRKFGIYWSLVRPFSGLIRKAILKQVRTKAESQKYR
jgi:hypothetical protein